MFVLLFMVKLAIDGIFDAKENKALVGTKIEKRRSTT